MKSGPDQVRSLHHKGETAVPLRSKILRGGGVALLAAIALLTGAAQSGQQSPPANPGQPDLAPPSNSVPDAKTQSQPAQPTLPTDPRKRQLTEDSARLLTLAIALKAEVDKTNKDTLSLNVIRRADEIEKLAHNVREKMKLTATSN
jgi:hypothetical protein